MEFGGRPKVADLIVPTSTARRSWEATPPDHRTRYRPLEDSISALGLWCHLYLFPCALRVGLTRLGYAYLGCSRLWCISWSCLAKTVVYFCYARLILIYITVQRHPMLLPRHTQLDIPPSPFSRRFSRSCGVCVDRVEPRPLSRSPSVLHAAVGNLELFLTLSDFCTNFTQLFYVRGLELQTSREPSLFVIRITSFSGFHLKSHLPSQPEGN